MDCSQVGSGDFDRLCPNQAKPITPRISKCHRNNSARFGGVSASHRASTWLIASQNNKQGKLNQNTTPRTAAIMIIKLSWIISSQCSQPKLAPSRGNASPGLSDSNATQSYRLPIKSNQNGRLKRNRNGSLNHSS